ncbi:MAG: methyltransferase domain-containing protein [Syntrophobacteria bacterium]
MMDSVHEGEREPAGSEGIVFSADAFSRLDETDDRVFYARDRFVQHLDWLALSTVEKLVGELIVGESPVILDLMAGWDSHIPPGLAPERVVGLGLNENELSQNKALTEWCLHDLNENPGLPFPDNTFDAVLNVVSVDYLTRPLEVFGEVGRILKPGGLFLVVFSNRMFEAKATKVWRESGEEERVILVEELFRHSRMFTRPQVFASKGKTRPRDDKYAHLGIPSDPVYAVYAEKKGGGSPGRRAPSKATRTTLPYPEELQRRMAAVKHTHRCPYCGERLRKWAVPQGPFTQWDAEYFYVCFNDQCPYLVRGWETMYRQGNRGVSYRLMYNPDLDRCMPIPVPGLRALKDGIID